MPTNNVDNITRPEIVEDLLKSSFRTMALFEYFSDMQRPLTIGEISAGLKIPQSSASSLVKSLRDSGYLINDTQTRTYTPSLRLSLLNEWVKKDNYHIMSLINALPKLQSQICETVILANRNGIYSQYVFVAHAEGRKTKQNIQHVQTGSLRPLVCSATGWALLTSTPEDDIGKLIRRTISETKNTYWKTTARHATDRIRTAKQYGYAYALGPSAKGTSGIATSLISNSIPSKFVLGIAGDSESIEKKKQDILEKLHQFLLDNNWESSILDSVEKVTFN